jgi:hypothetical protein
MDRETFNLTNIDNEIIRNYFSSSKRVRYSLFLIIIACIIAFSNYWNSRQNCWQKSRIDNVEDQLLFLQNEDKKACDIFPPQERHEIERIKRNRGEEYEMLIADLKFKKEQLLKHYYENTYFTNIPIIGVSFDTNDLSLIFGISLSLLLFFLYYSIDREFQNLRIIKGLLQNLKIEVEVDDRTLYKKVYELLSSYQILTLPRLKKMAPDYPTSNNLMGILKYMPKLLFTLPLFTYFLIYINDCKTFSLGEIVSSSNSMIAIITSGFILFFLIVFTMFIIMMAVRIDRLFNELHDKYLAALKVVENKDSN